MAISKRLIESFGGEITVSNKADLEPEFVILLPKPNLPNNCEEAKVDKQVIIIDDDPDILRSLSQTLELEGYQS